MDTDIPLVNIQPLPVAAEVSTMTPSLNTSSDMPDEAMAKLKAQGFPRGAFPYCTCMYEYSKFQIISNTCFCEISETGLAQELGKTKVTFPIRFWICDNSGSMQTSDGSELRGSNKESLQVVHCTRWKELQSTLEYHCELAGLISAQTIFRFLNDPGQYPQEFSIEHPSHVAGGIHIVRNVQPAGVTPLTSHLNNIYDRVSDLATMLRSSGQRAVVVIATDGLPSDNMGKSNNETRRQFIDGLRRLQSLPVWIVFRLCTDDNAVVEFYNELDRILEAPLEVIDDFFGEFEEIYEWNKWLNYTLPLHRCREMGYQHRIFDLLDERLLNKDELVEFLQVIFGEAMTGAPDIHEDYKGFESHVEKLNESLDKEWNVHKKKLTHWLDMKQIRKAYSDTNVFGFKKKR